jgi:hypothetical protein
VFFACFGAGRVLVRDFGYECGGGGCCEQGVCEESCLRAHIKAAAAHAQILKQNQRKKKVEYDFSGSCYANRWLRRQGVSN